MGPSRNMHCVQPLPAPARAEPVTLTLDASALQLARVRAHLLEALPIAAGVIGRDAEGRPELVAGNTALSAIDLGGDCPLVDRPGLADPIRTLLAGSGDVITLDWVDGDQITGRHYGVRIARIFQLDAAGPRFLITLIDRTAERATEKSLRLEMFNDSLTGLLNRAGFSDRLEAELADAVPGSFAVIVIDLLRFSRINESIGAISGDELLITVARRLLTVLAPGDVIARTGGDEFGLLVRVGTGDDAVRQMAERIHGVFAEPCRLSGLEIRIGCAVGCAMLEEDCDGDELVRRAQFAVKRAKATGRTELYTPRDFHRARRAFTIETALRRAIEADRLRLHFQPVVELGTGRLTGFEALARWEDNGINMSPAEVLPGAEQSGLIVPLGRWVLDAALATLKGWDARAGLTQTLGVAVNVSALQMARDDVAAMVASSLAAHGLDGRRLTLELTESSIVQDPDGASRTMHDLKALDTVLALDDFGTGYSSLAYLQRLPLDCLKIDRSFVTDMLANRDNLAIVRAVLSLAQALGLRTTAEGVETPELARMLAALGCTHAQGYVYAPALPADDALSFAQSWSSLA